MDAGGGEERALVRTPLSEESPDWQPLPTAIGAPGRPREACGDPSLGPGGVASVVAVGIHCDAALRIAARWEAAAGAGALLRQVRGLPCRRRAHSFDQVLVECEHAPRRRALAFVYRRPGEVSSAPGPAA